MSDKLLSFQFPDGASKPFPAGLTVRDILSQQLGEKALEGVLGVRVGDELLDLQSRPSTGGTVKPVYLKEDSPEARAFYRHSFSHILAQAVRRLPA